MAETLEGLFGPTPLQIQQAKQQQLSQNAAAFAKMDPFEKAGMLTYMGGGGLVNSLAPMTGGRDQQMELAQQRQQIAGAEGADLSTSEGTMAVANKFRQAGDLNTAMKLTLRAQALKKEESAQALQAAQAKQAEARANYWESGGGTTSGKSQGREIYESPSGNVERDPKTGKFYVPGTDTEISPEVISKLKLNRIGVEKVAAESTTAKPYVNDAGEVVYGSGKTLEGKKVGTADPAVVAALAAAKDTGKAGSELAVGDYKIARSANEVIPKIDDLIAQLEKDTVSTGTMAEWRLGFNKALALLGGKDAVKRATDTEIAAAMMNSEVYPLVQSLGIGARGMDTPAEREFLRSALTGSLPMEKGTLLSMARKRRDALQKHVSEWDASVNRGERDSFFKSMGLPKSTFVPPSTDVKTYGNAPATGMRSLADVRAAVAAGKISTKAAVAIMRDLDEKGLLK